MGAKDEENGQRVKMTRGATCVMTRLSRLQKITARNVKLIFPRFNSILLFSAQGFSMSQKLTSDFQIFRKTSDFQKKKRVYIFGQKTFAQHIL